MTPHNRDATAAPRNEPTSEFTLGIITYNSAKPIGRLLEELAQVPHILVADNNSSDTTVTRVRTLAPGAVVIAIPVNSGFARAANRIIHAATTKYVLLLNPDCHMPVASALELVRVAEQHPRAAIVAPILRYENRSLQRSFLPFDPSVTLKPSRQRAVRVRHVIGAAMLLRRRPILELGGFDEEFFLYGEDEDLCARTLRAGHEILLATSAEATHTYGASSKGTADIENLKAWHLGWSRARFALKCSGMTGLAARVARNTCNCSLGAVQGLRLSKRENATQRWHTLRGTLAFVCGKSAHRHNLRNAE